MKDNWMGLNWMCVCVCVFVCACACVLCFITVVRLHCICSFTMVSLYLWYCRPPWALTFFTEYTTIKLLLRPSIVPLNIDADPALHQYTAVGVGKYIIIVVISTKHSPAPCWRGYSTALDTVLGHLAADGTLSVVLGYTAIRASRYIVIIILTLSVVLSYILLLELAGISLL